MSIFRTEREMQQWLLKELKDNYGDFSKIISNCSKFEEYYHSAECSPNKVLDSFYSSLQSLYEITVLSDDRNISSIKGEVLKPDFVLFSHTTESLVLVELKNSPKTTREAGTELGAYNYELSNYLPNIPKLDFVHVIISNDYPVLLKHHIRHMIFLQDINILCLRPIRYQNRVTLEIINYNELYENNGLFFNRKIPASVLQSFQICIYDELLQQGSNDFNRLDEYLNLFKTALHNMSIIGNKLNSNGFAILWKDRYERYSLAPYSISIVYLPSYEQYKLDIPEFLEIYKNLNSILDEYPPTFGKTIEVIANEVRKVLSFDKDCSVRYEGLMDYRTWLNQDPLRCNYIAFTCWGEYFHEKHINTLNKLSIEEGQFLEKDNAYIGCEFLYECIDENS